MPADLKMSDFLFQAAQGLSKGASYAGQIGDKLYDAERVSEINSAQVEVDRSFYAYSQEIKKRIFGNPDDQVDPSNPAAPKKTMSLDDYRGDASKWVQDYLSKVSGTYKNPDAQKAIVNYISQKGLSLNQYVTEQHQDYQISQLKTQALKNSEEAAKSLPPNVAKAHIQNIWENAVATGVVRADEAYGYQLQYTGKVYGNVRNVLTNSATSLFDQVARGEISAQIALDIYTSAADEALGLDAITEAEKAEKITALKAQVKVASVISKAYETLWAMGTDGSRMFLDNPAKGNTMIQNANELTPDEKLSATSKFLEIYNQQKSIDSKTKADFDKSLTDPLRTQKQDLFTSYVSGKMSLEDLLPQVRALSTGFNDASKKMNTPDGVKEDISFLGSLAEAIEGEIEKKKTKERVETDQQLQDRVNVEKSGFDQGIAQYSFNGTPGSGSVAELQKIQQKIISSMPSWGKYSGTALALYASVTGEIERIQTGQLQTAALSDQTLAGSYSYRASQVLSKFVSAEGKVDYDALAAEAKVIQDEMDKDPAWKDLGKKGAAINGVSQIIDTIKSQKKIAAKEAKVETKEQEDERVGGMIADLGARISQNSFISSDKPGSKAELQKILTEAQGMNWGRSIDKLWAIEAKVNSAISDITTGIDRENFEVDTETARPLVDEARRIQTDFLQPGSDIAKLYGEAAALSKKLSETTFKGDKVKNATTDMVNNLAAFMKNESINDTKQKTADEAKADRDSAETLYDGIWKDVAKYGFVDAANKGDIKKLKDLREQIITADWKGSKDLAGSAFSLVSQMIDLSEKATQDETKLSAKERNDNAEGGWRQKVRGLRDGVLDYASSGMDSGYKKGFDASVAKIPEIRRQIEADTNLDGDTKQAILDDLAQVSVNAGNILDSIARADSATAKARAEQANNNVVLRYNLLFGALSSGGSIADQNLAQQVGTRTVSTGWLREWILKYLNPVDPDMAKTELSKLNSFEAPEYKNATTALEAMFSKYDKAHSKATMSETDKANERQRLWDAFNNPQHKFDLNTYLEATEKRIGAGLPQEQLVTEVLGTGGHLNQAGDDIVQQMWSGGYNFYSGVGEAQRAVIANALAETMGGYLGLDSAARRAIKEGMLGQKKAAETTPLTVQGIAGQKFYGMPLVIYGGKTYTFIPENYDDKKGVFTGPTVLGVVNGTVVTRVSDSRSMADLNVTIGKNNDIIASKKKAIADSKYFDKNSLGTIMKNTEMAKALGLTSKSTMDDVYAGLYGLYAKWKDAEAAKDKKADNYSANYAATATLLGSAMTPWGRGQLINWRDSCDTWFDAWYTAAQNNKSLEAIKKSR